MNRVIVQSRVDGDGVLRVVVPMGAAEADREVQVTVDPLSRPMGEQAEYIAWLDSIAGKWQGEFELMPQVGFETRDVL
jgi:hypothetical protein